MRTRGPEKQAGRQSQRARRCTRGRGANRDMRHHAHSPHHAPVVGRGPVFRSQIRVHPHGAALRDRVVEKPAVGWWKKLQASFAMAPKGGSEPTRKSARNVSDEGPKCDITRTPCVRDACACAARTPEPVRRSVRGGGALPRARCLPADRMPSRSWDEKQRERSRLARLAMLERDNHHTDNTHMMKVQNLADDEIVGGGVLAARALRRRPIRLWPRSAGAPAGQPPTHASAWRCCSAGLGCPANNCSRVAARSSDDRRGGRRHEKKAQESVPGGKDEEPNTRPSACRRRSRHGQRIWLHLLRYCQPTSPSQRT